MLVTLDLTWAIRSWLLRRYLALTSESLRRRRYGQQLTPLFDAIAEATREAAAVGDVRRDYFLARSPQAKGRVERANATMQDRLEARVFAAALRRMMLQPDDLLARSAQQQLMPAGITPPDAAARDR